MKSRKHFLFAMCCLGSTSCADRPERHAVTSASPRSQVVIEEPTSGAVFAPGKPVVCSGRVVFESEDAAKAYPVLVEDWKKTRGGWGLLGSRIIETEEIGEEDGRPVHRFDIEVDSKGRSVGKYAATIVLVDSGLEPSITPDDDEPGPGNDISNRVEYEVKP